MLPVCGSLRHSAYPNTPPKTANPIHSATRFPCRAKGPSAHVYFSHFGRTRQTNFGSPQAQAFRKLRELLKQKNFDYADDIWVSSDRRMGAADARGIFLPGGRKQVFRD